MACTISYPGVLSAQMVRLAKLGQSMVRLSYFSPTDAALRTGAHSLTVPDSKSTWRLNGSDAWYALDPKIGTSNFASVETVAVTW